MYINGIDVNQTTGRAIISSTALPAFAPGNSGFLYDSTNDTRKTALSSTPTYAVNGFGMDADRQSISVTLPSGDDTRINGLRVALATGVMAVSTTAPIAFWNQGWPMSALGELCID
jgi:hypothetical protein